MKISKYYHPYYSKENSIENRNLFLGISFWLLPVNEQTEKHFAEYDELQIVITVWDPLFDTMIGARVPQSSSHTNKLLWKQSVIAHFVEM